MKRWIFNSCSVVSLLLFATAAVMWVRSYYDVDFLWYGQIGAHIDRIGIILEPGQVQLFGEVDKTKTPDADEWQYSHWPAPRDGHVDQPEFYYNVYWNRWKFQFWSDSYPPGSLRSWAFAVPHWLLLILFGVLPGLWCVTRRKAKGRAFPVELSKPTEERREEMK